jgi:hypothetical protein
MKKYLTILFVSVASSLFAQDDLMKELEQTQKSDVDYAFQTFKGTRLINGHTVETKGKGNLEFIFAHRFGGIKGGLYEMFGLDQAYVRLGLDYGITDNISVSIGRNSVDKTMDGYVKYKFLRQAKGARNIPVTITALGGTAYQTSPRNLEVGTNIDRLAYVGQLLIARKFNPRFSFQFMPTIVHRNAVDRSRELNDQFALGMGGRIKLTRSVALTTEYYYRFNVPNGNQYYNTFGLGIDIETGGHVFQLILTNTRGLTERAFITQTENQIGDFHLGFNVTRTFQLKKK